MTELDVTRANAHVISHEEMSGTDPSMVGAHPERKPRASSAESFSAIGDSISRPNITKGLPTAYGLTYQRDTETNGTKNKGLRTPKRPRDLLTLRLCSHSFCEESSIP
jgi:hypothetical protein